MEKKGAAGPNSLTAWVKMMKAKPVPWTPWTHKSNNNVDTKHAYFKNEINRLFILNLFFIEEYLEINKLRQVYQLQRVISNEKDSYSKSIL